MIKEGSQGPLVAEFAFVRVTPIRDELPGPRHELVRVSGLRWPVETALEEAKGEGGMDHYETRTWLGWHHHMTHAILRHRQRRNYAAYCSHRKRTRSRLSQRRPKRRKGKVS